MNKNLRPVKSRLRGDRLHQNICKCLKVQTTGAAVRLLRAVTFQRTVPPLLIK